MKNKSDKVYTKLEGQRPHRSPENHDKKKLNGIIIQTVWTMLYNKCRSCIYKNPFFPLDIHIIIINSPFSDRIIFYSHNTC